MNYREVVIEDDKSIADSGTETIDINVTDPITELMVRFNVTNGGAVTRDEPPQQQISKIEIIDGGQVYWSMDGPEAVAAAAYDIGRMPQSWFNEHENEDQSIYIPLRFGRYLADPAYGFVPERLVNPQLKFTWTDQPLYADGSLTLGILAKIMEGAADPPRCLMWMQVEDFTTAASGVKSIDMPRDYPYRRMLVRAYDDYTVMDSILTHFKLDCDLGKFLPFDIDVSEFENIVKSEFGPFEYHKMDMYDDQESAQAWMGGDTIALAAAGTHSVAPFAWASGCSWYRTWYEDIGGVGPTTLRCQTLVKGDFPECAWCYQFGRKNEAVEWFDPVAYKDLKLKLTQGLADAEASVSVQQVRTLP